MGQKRYQFGVSSWFGYRLHMSERAKLIKDAGFEATLLYWVDEEKENTGSLHDLPGIIRDQGLVIDHIHAPFGSCDDLWSPDKSVRQKIVEQYLGWLGDCARHGIGKMVIHLNERLKTFPSENRDLTNIKQILKAAEELKIIIAVENIFYNEFLDQAFSEIDSPYLAFCYDSSHDFLYSDEPAEILCKWGRRLATTHLSDNDGQDDRHWHPGGGIIDWQKIAAAFPKQQYSGPLMLELLPNNSTPKLSAETFLKKAHNSLCSIAPLFEK